MGSNHIRYFEEDGTAIRVTTDAPLALIENETPFVLTRPMYLVFGNDEAFPGDLASTAQRFCGRNQNLLAELGASSLHLL